MTKRFIYTFMFLIIGTLAFAQPSNDDPCNAISLNVSSSCVYTSYTNAMATNTTGVVVPGCAAYAGGDVWFKFTMPDNGFHVYLDMRAAGITEGGMAVYSGNSCGALTLVDCDENSGTGDMPALVVDDGCNFSEAGKTFWVRVWEEGNDNNGTFDLCAFATTAPVPAGVESCASNIVAGNSCCDAVLLSDMFDGFCGNTGGYNDEPSNIGAFCAGIENNSWIAFTASDPVAVLNITSSNCKNVDSTSHGIQVGVFATTDCANFSLVSNCWNLGTEGTGNITSTGLTPGDVYYLMVDGWQADSCDYTISVVSGVEVTNVTATDSEICAGQSSTLSVNTTGVGPFTYMWSPGGGNKADTTVNPLVSTDYTVTVTNAGTPSIHTVSIIVYPNSPPTPSISGSNSVCENSTGVIYNASTNFATSYNWTVTGGGTISGSNTDASVSVDWGTTGGNLCVDATNECGTSAQTCSTISVIPQPNISAIDPPISCASTGVDLTSITINNSGSGGGPISYHANQSDAEAGINFISPSVNTSGTYWIRMQTSPTCYDVTSVDVVIEDPNLNISTPSTTCTPNTINLDSGVNVTETNGYPGTETYFTDSLDAVNNINELGSPVVSMGGAYWVRYETSNGCIAVGRITVNISVTPAFADANPSPLCQGALIDLDTVTMVDANNATIASTNYYNNLSFAQSNFTFLALPSTIVTAGTYWVTNVNNEGCIDVAQINVSEYTTPDGSISGGGTVCPGDSIDLTFNLSGTGPFEVTYSNLSQPPYTLTGISDGHVERVPALSGTTYTLDAFTDGNGCDGNITGAPVVVNVNALPIGGMVGGGTFCANATSDLTFNLIGSGPFDVEYTDGNQTYTLNNISNGHTESILLLNDSTFTMTSVTDAQGCTDTGSGTVNFTVYQPLQIINLSENCNVAKTGYTVSFEITGGDPANYMISGGTGNLVGNSFMSTEITSNTAYNFTVSDGTGCPTDNVNGLQECTCITDAGTMDLTPLTACGNNTITAIHNSDETLESGDILLFVIHDAAGNILGNTFGISITPVFGLQGGMTAGTTYYISSIAGPDNGMGGIDVAHACLSVSPGTPVVFYEAPVATISGDATVCNGNSTEITFNFTAGTGPFDVVYTANGVSTTLDDINDGHQITVNPTSSTTYEIASVADNSASACPGSFSGTATVTVNAGIQLANIVETCNPAKTGYRISFDITGGDPSSYAVTGSAGVLTGTSFVSDEIPSGDPFNFIIGDSGPCVDITLTGTKDCDCLTTPGTMNMTLLEVCIDDTATGIHNNDHFLDPSTNDILRFALHDAPGSTLGNVMSIATTPVFTWQAGMTDGATYYISPIAGPDNGTGSIDQLHKCFRVGDGTPVQFLTLPDVVLSGSNTICEGESANLVLTFNAGTPPFDVVITDGSTFDTIQDITSGHVYQAWPSSNTSYSLINVWDNTPNSCEGTFSGTADITVLDIPEVSAPSFGCNNINTQFQVSFEITGGTPANYQVAAGAGNLDMATNIFTSDFMPSGSTYYFEVTDGTGCDPVIITGDYTCSCTTDAGLMQTSTIEVCSDETAIGTWLLNSATLDGNDVLGYVLHDSPGTTLGNVLLTNTIPEFNYDPTLTYGTTYYISSVAANDDGAGFPVLTSAMDVCLSVSNGQPVVFYESPVASWTGATTICEGDTTDLLFSISGTGPFDITYTDGTDTFAVNGVNDATNFEVNPALTTTYTLLTVQGNGPRTCIGSINGSAASVTIDVIDVPEIRNLTIGCNIDGTEFTVAFDLFGGNNTNYQISGDTTLTLSGNSFTSRVYTGGSTYYFEITDGSGCPPIILTDTEFCNCTPDIRPLVSLDSPISCGGYADGVLKVIPINGLAPYTFDWSNGDVGTSSDSLSVGWHYVSMTDANNCLTTDSIFMQEPTTVTANLDGGNVDCHGEENGTILITDAQGGAGNYDYYLDGVQGSFSGLFTNLAAGTYIASVLDQNDCEWNDTISIEEPEELTIDLGEDQFIVLGDSTQLVVNANLSIDEFFWSPEELVSCDSCLSQFVKPEFTTIFRVRVVNQEGCEAEDEVVINVNRDVPVYIPTAFTPNGDGFNDTFTVYGGDQIDRVSIFRIFSRWGALLYEVTDMAPGDESAGWDGGVDLEQLNGGVYVYFVEVVLSDGTRKVVTGDVTLIR